MAQFNSVVLTDQGINLISKALAGECRIEFTKVQTGDGAWDPDPVELRKVTALKNVKQETRISRAKVINEKTVDVRAVLDNKEVTEGYYFKEYGIFACEKENEEGTEILYAIVVALEDQWDYMAPFNGVSPQMIEMDVYVAVAYASEVSIKLGSGAYATADDVKELYDMIRGLKNRQEYVQSLIEIRDKIRNLESVHPMFAYDPETSTLAIDESEKESMPEIRYQDDTFQIKNESGEWEDSSITFEEVLAETQNMAAKLQKMHPMLSYDEETGTLTIDESGEGGGNSGSSSYVLPAASKSTLGGVKIGSGLDVSADGTVSVDNQSVLNGITATESEAEEAIDDSMDKA